MLKEISTHISIWIIIVPFIAGLLNYKGLNRDSKWIFVLVCVGIEPQILTEFVSSQNAALNLSYNIYTPVEFLIVYLLFLGKHQQERNKFILKLTFCIYTAVASIVLITEGLKTEFISWLVSLNCIIYMIWVLLFLKEQYNIAESDIRSDNPFAWYLLGLLIYVPSSVIFAIYDYIRETNKALLDLWIIPEHLQYPTVYFICHRFIYTNTKTSFNIAWKI